MCEISQNLSGRPARRRGLRALPYCVRYDDMRANPAISHAIARPMPVRCPDLPRRENPRGRGVWDTPHARGFLKLNREK
jgi:hypothetical protein